MQVNIELSETDKAVLQCALQNLFQFCGILGDMGYNINNWGAPEIDRNAIFNVAEQFGIEL